ncbi:MAG: MarR family transcriptional regulator [Ilumatobacteraceae bacterium]
MNTKEDIDTAAETLLIASRAFIGIAARSFAGVDDITLPQYRALVVLTRASALTVGDLAEALDVHSSTATRVCDRLEMKRMLRRRPGASADRRLTTVALTAKGRRLVGRVTEHRLRDLATIAAAMSPGDLKDTIRALTAFADAAGEGARLDRFGWSDSTTATQSHFNRSVGRE